MREPSSALFMAGVATSTAGAALMVFGFARIPCSGDESLNGPEYGTPSPCTAARYAPYLIAGASALSAGIVMIALRPSSVHVQWAPYPVHQSEATSTSLKLTLGPQSFVTGTF